MAKRKLVRLSANITENDVESLKEIAEYRGGNMTEALRDAIATEAFVTEVLEKGGKILVERADGTIERVIFR
jgi:hypothetical protein